MIRRPLRASLFLLLVLGIVATAALPAGAGLPASA